jgi:multisubunit Na+/H+ antiporter MnhE subunit
VKRFAEYVAKWLAFIILWLIFVYQISLPELFAGAAAAGLTVFALEKTLKAEPFRFSPELRWWAQIWRLPGIILEDFAALLQTLGRHAVGKRSLALFQLTPFHTSGDPARQAAQRCLATTFMSLSPNSVVVDIDTERDVMMFHQVKQAPVPLVIRKLEE